MKMKKISYLYLLAVLAVPFCLASCSSTSVVPTSPKQNIYQNNDLGLSMAFPVGWQLIPQKQYQPNTVSIADPQMVSLFDAICQKALFCAVNNTGADGAVIAAMGVAQKSMEPWSVFDANIQAGVNFMKTHGQNNLQITQDELVEIHQQKFIHVVQTQEINNKTYTIDTYYTQYPTFSLDYVAIGYAPNVVSVNTAIMQSYYHTK